MRVTNTGDVLATLDCVESLDNHFHAPEDWVGKSGDQSGNDWAVVNGLTPFRCISGNGDFGSDANDEAKILGSDDTPIRAGNQQYGAHRLFVVGVSSSSTYVMRIIWGDSTMAAAITAGQYTTVMIKFDPVAPAQTAGTPFDIQIERQDQRTKLWAQCKNASDNSTIDFFVGVHEYE